MEMIGMGFNDFQSTSAGSTQLAKLKSKADGLLSEAEAFHKKLASQNRMPSDAENAQFKSLIGQLDQLSEQIKAEANTREILASKIMQSTQGTDGGSNLVYGANGAGGYSSNTGFDFGPNTVTVNVRDPQLVAFKGRDAARNAYDSGLWLKSRLLSHTSRHSEGQAAYDKLVSRRGESWFATQNETSATDGGYLVPPEFDQAVTVYREQVGAVRKLARIVNVGHSDTWTGAKQTTGTTVYYPGEEGAITPSSAAFSRYTLTMKKRAILAYVSSELRDDAMPSIMDILASDMGHQFALQEDNEGIKGDGTSAYGGVLGLRPSIIAATASIATAASASTWVTLGFDDFASTMSLVADKFRVPSEMSWLCSAAFKYQVMDRLAINANGALSTVWVDGQPVPMFLGFPVVISDRMPTSTAVSTVCCLFGNFPQAVVLGERTGVAIATSEHVAFTTDQIAVRGITRYDINVHQEGDTSTAGAIVGLKTHS